MNKNEQLYRKNDRIRLTITDMGVSGEGIGRILGSAETLQMDSPVFFVKNAVIGDEVLAVVTRMKKGYGYAKVLEILVPSKQRVTPACPLAERCGGCQIMQLSYEAQLRFKEEKVRGDLEHIAGQSCEDFYSIIGMQEPLHFRNKMQFPVGWDREGHVITGFYAGRTHYIIAAPQCPVASESACQVISAVRKFLEDYRVSTYQEETGKGLVRHILIRNGFYTGQIMVCLVINGDSLELEKCDGSKAAETEFSEYLAGITLPEPWKIRSVCLNINKENTNVILGQQTRCLYGDPFIEDRIISRKTSFQSLGFRISPKSFFQTNPEQTGILYDTVLDFAGLTGKETVWDLYCGIGTISLFLAQKARMVYGVEIIPEAIEDAKANAERNGIENTQFYCGNAEEVFPAKTAGRDEGCDVVVLDPPRKGCAPELLEAINTVSPDRIVYVSCDPATLARDVKCLCEYGYRLEKVQPVDMFPHTVHVEVVTLLQKMKHPGKNDHA